MKYTLVILTFVAAVTALPTHEQNRHRRDVSEIVDAQPANIYLPPAEPQNIYLPPVEPQIVEEPSVKEKELPTYLPPAEPQDVEESPVHKNELSIPEENESRIPASNDEPAVKEAIEEITTEAVPETAVLGDNGYVYRTVRRLRLRQRRDVSHLNLEYLPPVEAPQLELNYLPPHLDDPQAMPQLTVSNEYLPPLNEKVVLKEQTTEAQETEAPATGTPATEAPTTEAPTTEAPTTQAPTTEATTTTEAATTQAPTTEEPITGSSAFKEVTHQDTAILAEDGYHYKKPAVLPDLGGSPMQKSAAPEQNSVLVDVLEQNVVVEPELAYLPPLEYGMVEVEGPAEDTAALLDDGYHYRVVKQVRLF